MYTDTKIDIDGHQYAIGVLESLTFYMESTNQLTLKWLAAWDQPARTNHWFESPLHLLRHGIKSGLHSLRKSPLSSYGIKPGRSHNTHGTESYSLV